MNKDTKMVRVTSRGMVTTSRGRVMSPIMSPYRETVDRIWGMITVDRADVEEQLPDKTFVKLTVQNFDKDNYVSKKAVIVNKPEPSHNGPSPTNNEIKVEQNQDNKTPEEVADNVERTESGSETIEVDSEANAGTDEVTTENSSTENQDSAETEQVAEQRTITVNGEKRVDPRYNKKNKKNRNNTQNDSSIAVAPESVQ